MDFEVFSVAFFIIQVVILFFSKGPVFAYSLMLTVSSLYYGILGPLYWMHFNGGSFLGVDWSDQIPRASMYINASGALMSGTASLYQMVHGHVRGGTRHQNLSTVLGWQRHLNRSWVVLSIVSALCCVYVAAFMVGGTADLQSDKFLLIAYQMSDIAVVCIIFSIATRGYSASNVMALLLFVVYAAAIGFRYKLIVLLFPLIWIEVTKANLGVWKKASRGVVMGTFIIVAFTLLTLVRSKFGGFDLTGLEAANFDGLLYGLFAETNSIFGLIGVIREAVDAEQHIGVAPIRDSVLELIPRFLFPSRNTGEYLALPLIQLISPEALTSGTAYPVAGELLLMGGQGALILGSVTWGLVYIYFTRPILALGASAQNLKSAVTGLLAVFFGYYAFSRGYLPQTSKGILFFALPICWLTYCYVRATELVSDENADALFTGRQMRPSNA